MRLQACSLLQACGLLDSPCCRARLQGGQAGGTLTLASCRKPYHSLNFIIAHDGFVLADLCAYNDKHNDANGEQNRDGSNDNFGWNCGAEGPTQDGDILWRRERQMRNLMVALLVSQGMPMVLSGTPAPCMLMQPCLQLLIHTH